MLVSEQRIILLMDYFNLMKHIYFSHFVVDKFSDLQLKLSNLREWFSVSICENTWGLGV